MDMSVCSGNRGGGNNAVNVFGCNPAVTKTPVSWLHEICTRSNITPKYDLLQIEGAVHEPIFQYRLTLELMGKFYEEMGTGRSKKEAKHNTARAMLKAMNILPYDDDPTTSFGCQTTGSYDMADDLARIGVVDDVGGNPVGVLQELCMKMKLPPPSYEVYSEEGLPHERLFAMECKVSGEYSAIGRGKSKKLAKRAAAFMMAETLRSIPLETSHCIAFDDDDDKIDEQLSSLSIGQRKAGISKQVVGGIGQLYLEFSELIQLDIITKLHTSPKIPDEEVESFINDLGEELGWRAMFIEVDELSTKDECQCLVQLTLEPPLVFFGSGSDATSARISCAQDIVGYFRLLTKTVFAQQEQRVADLTVTVPLTSTPMTSSAFLPMPSVR